jgi:uncharacterized membrane-anchored protein
MSYSAEWVVGAAVVGFVACLCVPSFFLIGLAVLLVAALLSAVALAAAIVASPYLVARSILRSRRARSGARQRSTGLAGRGLKPAPSQEI